MKPKKLIRSGIVEKLKDGEWEQITDQEELNALYEMKIKEEVAEIKNAEYKDVNEFADLVSAVMSYAMVNGFTRAELLVAIDQKSTDKGNYGMIALNNLNPENPSNKIYFEK